jgi:hypothetical protein
MLAAMREYLPIPEDDELAVRGNAAVQVAAGACMAMIGGLVFAALDD